MNSVNIPIISWIFHKITGATLDLFDFITLCFAIPSAVLYSMFHPRKKMKLKTVTPSDISTKPPTDLPLSHSMKSVRLEVRESDPPAEMTTANTDDSPAFAESFIIFSGALLKLTFVSIGNLIRREAESITFSQTFPVLITTIKAIVSTYSKDES